MGSSPAILGIVAPHPPIMVEAVGGVDSAVTSASITAMQAAARTLATFRPEAIVVISPHAFGYADALTVDTAHHLSGTLERFGARDVRITASNDLPLAREIIDSMQQAGIGVADRAADPRAGSGQLDHGVLVPLSFLDPAGSVPLVVLSLSGLPLQDHRRAGECIASAATSLGRRIALVASGDLSHRLTKDAPAGFAPEAAEFDRIVVDLFHRSRLDELVDIDPELINQAGECGLRSFVALSGALPTARCSVLAYEGPWGVGYLTALVADQATLVELEPVRADETELTPDTGRKGGRAGHDTHPIVVLARSTIEAHLRGEPAPPRSLPQGVGLPAAAGAFVTLYMSGSLRGCIGTIRPTCRALAEEVAVNAIKAATEDPRFPPLTLEELADLEVKVDVLHPPEPACFEELDPSTYGVIVSSGSRKGLLLPALDGVDTAEEQLSIACRKGNIEPGAHVRIERFRVDRYT